MQFPIHTKETAPEASRATLEATAKKYRFLPNLFGVLAESPTAVQAYAAINKALEQSALSPVEQQVVALTVSTTNDCAHCVGVHSTVAQMVRACPRRFSPPYGSSGRCQIESSMRSERWLSRFYIFAAGCRRMILSTL